MTILLSVLRDLAVPKIGAAIHSYICQTGDPIKGTSDVFRLTPRERDAECFRTSIQAEAATASLPDARQFSDARARMLENAAFLRDRLKEFTENQRRRLTMYIAQRSYLVVVAASDQESAFRIFSVLNSRGLDLTPADVLKAEIIGALPADKQDSYTAQWEDIEDELGRERFAELTAERCCLLQIEITRADEKADADWPMPDAEVDGRHDSQPGNMGTAVRGQKHRRAGGAEMAISANISPISWSRWRLRHSTDLSKPWWRQV